MVASFLVRSRRDVLGHGDGRLYAFSRFSSLDDGAAGGRVIADDGSVVRSTPRQRELAARDVDDGPHDDAAAIEQRDVSGGENDDAATVEQGLIGLVGVADLGADDGRPPAAVFGRQPVVAKWPGALGQ